jgi:hypothetical protein
MISIFYSHVISHLLYRVLFKKVFLLATGELPRKLRWQEEGVAVVCSFLGSISDALK